MKPVKKRNPRAKILRPTMWWAAASWPRLPGASPCGLGCPTLMQPGPAPSAAVHGRDFNQQRQQGSSDFPSVRSRDHVSSPVCCRVFNTWLWRRKPWCVVALASFCGVNTLARASLRLLNGCQPAENVTMFSTADQLLSQWVAKLAVASENSQVPPPPK